MESSEASGNTPRYNLRRRRLVPKQINTPESRYLFDLWASKCRPNAFPARSDFDPVEFKHLLPDILLIDVLREPFDFRYRLAGTRTYDIHKTELTGKSVRELVPRQFASLLWDDLCELVDTRTPQYVALEFTNAAGLSRSYRVLRLPLSSDGATIDMVLIYADFGAEREQIEEIFQSLRDRAPSP